MAEFAMVAPVMVLLMLGLLVGGLGVFRYQQVAHLARDASRWAAVHGSDYALETGKAAAAPADVYTNVIVPNAKGLDLSKITYSVTWNTSNSPYYTTTANGQTVKVTNSVTVVVNYRWTPEAFLGAMTLSSTSTCVMSY